MEITKRVVWLYGFLRHGKGVPVLGRAITAVWKIKRTVKVRWLGLFSGSHELKAERDSVFVGPVYSKARSLGIVGSTDLPLT